MTIQMPRPGDTPAKPEPPALRPVRLPTEILPVEEAEQQHRAAQEKVMAYKVEMSSQQATVDELERQIRFGEASGAEAEDILLSEQSRLKNKSLRLAALLADERDALIALKAARLPGLYREKQDADAAASSLKRDLTALEEEKKSLISKLEAAKVQDAAINDQANDLENQLKHDLGEVLARQVINLAVAEKVKNERQGQS